MIRSNHTQPQLQKLNYQGYWDSGPKSVVNDHPIEKEGTSLQQIKVDNFTQERKEYTYWSSKKKDLWIRLEITDLTRTTTIISPSETVMHNLLKTKNNKLKKKCIKN